MNVKGLLAYEGTRYLGWQKTKMGPSVEECLEKALSQMFQRDFVLQAASRTDRGVHAEGQVFNFFLCEEVDLRKLQRSLNGLLPKDISLLRLERMREEFHPTLDCTGKEYHYQICNTSIQLPFHRAFSWHYPYPLCVEAMREGAAHLIGTHDFSAFCNEKLGEKNAVRHVDLIEIRQLPEGRLCIAVKGNHFLYKMVRNLVGTLVYVGCGKLNVEDLPRILENRNRVHAGMTAPAHGLSLKEVFYSV
jgi:tRNA pseudouridine38-40 synthase